MIKVANIMGEAADKKAKNFGKAKAPSPKSESPEMEAAEEKVSPGIHKKASKLAKKGK